MIRTLIDLVSFFNTLSGFLVALVFWTIITIVFAKSIKKHAKALYWIFGVLGASTLLPILNLFGIKMTNVIFLPVLGDVFIEFTYATYFIHPMLVIIMYMGALSPKIPAVGKLMNIRKELSIIVGFAVIPHALKRIIMTFPHAWNYFADHAELVAQNKVVSELGQGISNGVYVMGILMTVLFLVLWVTSFGGVRKRMGSKKWKSVQRWSYVLYAMLFIHAIGIDTGSLISYYDMQARKAQTEVTGAAPSSSMQKPQQGAEAKAAPSGMGMMMQRAKKEQSPKASFLGMSMKEETPQKGGAHNFSGKFKFSNVEFSTPCKCIVNIFILLAVYGSYLFLRLRKARLDRERKRGV